MPLSEALEPSHHFQELRHQVYNPVVVVFEDPAPAIVPPVAIILMVGLLFVVIHSTPFIHLAADLS